MKQLIFLLLLILCVSCEEDECEIKPDSRSLVEVAICPGFDRTEDISLSIIHEDGRSRFTAKFPVALDRESVVAEPTNGMNVFTYTTNNGADTIFMDTVYLPPCESVSIICSCDGGTFSCE